MEKEKKKLLGQADPNGKLDALLKYAQRVSVIGRFLACCMLLSGGFLIVGMLAFFFYLHSYADFGIWKWIIPPLFSLIPLVAVCFFWYVFDLLGNLPETMKSLKDEALQLYPKYKDKFQAVKEYKGFSKRVRQTSVLMNFGYDVFSLLGDGEDISMGVTFLTFGANPLAWLIAVGAMVSCFVTVAIYLIIVLVHYFWFI